MNIFEASITFYADSNISEVVEGLPNVNVDDAYLDDDGDWCIDCTAYIRCARASMEAVHKKLSERLKRVPACWDYHYIKGVDIEFWWQP